MPLPSRNSNQVTLKIKLRTLVLSLYFLLLDFAEELPAERKEGVLFLGQEQDVMGGGTYKEQSFSGKIGLFSIWSRILERSELDQILKCKDHLQGDIVGKNMKKYCLVL